MSKKIKEVKISEIKQGLVRQQKLPEGFIERVIKYKITLSEVELSSLEETVNNFQRDVLPEKELVVWEDISRVYQKIIRKNPDLKLHQKKEIFGILLSSTMR